jgi:hypothetical protein
MRKQILQWQLCCLVLAALACGCQSERRTVLTAKGTQYEGSLDGATVNSISGWAWKISAPNEAVEVEIYDGNSLIGTAKADRLREDLTKARKGNGRHAFDFATPASLKDGTSHSISARVAGTDFQLREQPISVTQSKP